MLRSASENASVVTYLWALSPAQTDRRGAPWEKWLAMNVSVKLVGVENWATAWENKFSLSALEPAAASRCG
jgi:hypothetical protein